MSLAIGASFRDGASRLASRAGLTLLAAYFVTMLVYQVAFTSLLEAILGRFDLPTTVTYPFTVDAPPAVLGVAVLVLLVGMTALSAVAVRTFVAGARDRIPREFYTRRMGWVTLNLIVGGLVVGLLVFVGTLLLVIPGIVAYVGLVFVTMYVAAEDENFVAAIKHSWRLARRDFISVFGLVLVLVVGSAVVGGVFGLVASLGTLAAGVSQGWQSLVTSVFYVPVTLYVLAVLSAAFVQLRDETDDQPPESRSLDEEFSGATSD
jgi:hypothetical protein